MIWPLIFAIVSPIFWGIMNMIDKYALSKRVRNTAGFLPVYGIVHLATGIIIALFLDWSNIRPIDLLFPAIAGILFGCQCYFYVFAMKKEDASHVIGLAYAYPILLALLSFIFLKEVIPLQGYIGMIIVIAGVILLSLRFIKFKLANTGWLILQLILVIALTEFFVKIATGEIPVMQGIAINSLSLGTMLLLLLLNKKIRTGFRSEIKNIHWAVASESFTLLGTGTLYYAMAGLPATIVASIGATQPLVVLFLERITDGFTGKLTKDHALLPKLGIIALIVIGVVILCLSGVV